MPPIHNIWSRWFPLPVHLYRSLILAKYFLCVLRMHGLTAFDTFCIFETTLYISLLFLISAFSLQHGTIMSMTLASSPINTANPRCHTRIAMIHYGYYEKSYKTDMFLLNLKTLQSHDIPFVGLRYRVVLFIHQDHKLHNKSLIIHVLDWWYLK